MAIAVTIKDRAYFYCYGVATKDEAVPVSETTLFEIGSVSKTFTATLASYAQATDKLSLLDHPSRFIPQLKNRAIDEATLLNLGTYTAGGLPLQFPDEVEDDQAIDYFSHWQRSVPIGTRQYSNPSIGLLGDISARALGVDFAEAMERTLLPALGLSHSYLRVPQSEMVNYAWGYNQNNQPVRLNPGVFDLQAYGMRSTAADMIRFVQLNIDGRKLVPDMAQAILGTHKGYFKVGAMIQGLGWEMYPYPVKLTQLLSGNSEKIIFDANAGTRLTPNKAIPAATLFNKTGSTGGFGAYVAFVPEKRIGLVMLANKRFPIPDRVKVSHAILSQLARGSSW